MTNVLHHGKSILAPAMYLLFGFFCVAPTLAQQTSATAAGETKKPEAKRRYFRFRTLPAISGNGPSLPAIGSACGPKWRTTASNSTWITCTRFRL